MNIKILHILNTASYSGAENVVCQIIKMYEYSDFTMAYCSRDGQIRDVIRGIQIPFYPILGMTRKEINRVIEEFKPDIIHAHDMRAAYISSYNNINVPVICHIHNNAYDSRRVSKKSIAFLFASLRIKHIFWVSEEAFLQYAFRPLVKSKSSILYNIIDINTVAKKVQDDSNSYKFDIIFLGRLASEKNPMRLLKILEQIKPVIPSIKLAIVGDGAYKEQLERYIIHKELEKNVVFMGFQKNPLKMLKDSSLMIMTSLSEGLPMCALEAQILGTPIVCTPVGALDKIVIDGVNGFLCESDEMFVNRITSIIMDKRLREKLSNNSISFAKTFNEKKKFIMQLTGEYQKALQG